MEKLAQHIESLIFTTDHAVDLDEIASVLEEAFGMKFPEEELLEAIDQLKARYAGEEFAFEIAEIGGGYQFLSKGAYHPTIGIFLRQTTNKRLSRSALETLSIVAYKQPVTKSELEKIRGVSCDYAMQKLLEKELVMIIGRSDGPGKPLLYGTSTKFMDYFGISSIEDLPKPKEFSNPDSTIGELAPIEEDKEVLKAAAGAEAAAPAPSSEEE
ncbi:MAG: SMC-Scp complex subunit ScpB [Bacteroidota bacterium]